MTVPHRRWNPLLQEWVLVSPHRASRPWQGAKEVVSKVALPAHDSTCYLCPRNQRVNGDVNPDYSGTFVFDNDFAALLPNSITGPVFHLNGLINAQPVTGTSRVICFSPRHDQPLPELSLEQIKAVIKAWDSEYRTLSIRSDISHVMTFENKGEIMGCSNPHPHSQIWATSTIPNIPARMFQSQREHRTSHGCSLVQEYGEWEVAQKDRVIVTNEHWIVVVPFWAVWPYEVMILPRRRSATISELSEEQIAAWADAIKSITTAYDKLFETSFPYSMGIYQAPCDGSDLSALSLIQVFFPPLLRSSTVKKFMVGFELCAEPQRDLSPETAAGNLRALVKP